MTILARNVAANIAGAVFIAVLTLGTAPLVLRWLGAEAYGLVAFQATMQALLLLLDLGFSTAINREIALLSTTPDGSAGTRSVMRTALPFYWAAALGLGAVMMAAAPLIADRWLTGSLPRAVIVDAVRWMSLTLAAQFLVLPYAAAYLGLQRQVLYSALSSLHVLLRVGGGVAVAFAARDVRLFFAWQVLASALHVVMLAVILQRVMPAGPSERRPELMRGAWALARGMALITVLASVTSQADKLAVSGSSTLTVFGYYGIASLLAVTTAGAAGPLANAVFPRFTQLQSRDDRRELTLAYRRATQTASAIILPLACVLAVWSREVLHVWTGQPSVPREQSAVLMLLVAGMAMNGLLTVPYMLQLAHGWTRPAILWNAGALLTFVPAMFVAASRWGPLGTAVVFAAMHAGFLISGLAVNQMRLLDRAGSLFARDVAGPLLVSLLITIGGHILLPGDGDRLLEAAQLVGIAALAFFASVAATPAVREWIAGRWAARPAP
jgi:O-antigen/teichoic acid export membrane protein